MLMGKTGFVVPTGTVVLGAVGIGSLPPGRCVVAEEEGDVVVEDSARTPGLKTFLPTYKPLINAIKINVIASITKIADFFITDAPPL
jgi:hypothetical protein